MRDHPLHRASGGGPDAGAAVDPSFRRRALERWDRILLAHETLRLLAACQGADDLGEPTRLLEVGCRTGLGSRLWLRRGRVALTAVDVSTERLAVASARTSAPHWLRRDPRYLSGVLPGAPFDRIIVYPWVVGSVRPERLEQWLRDLAALLRPGPRSPQGGRMLVVLYRPSHLVQRWGHQTGGQDTGQWAWAWEGYFDASSRRQDLHLMAFLPTNIPGRFTRHDEVVVLHAHPQDRFLNAARAAGLSGGERAAARTGSLLLYQLTRVNPTGM